MIAIYGANGFIGRHLTRRLAAGVQPVRAISRRFERSFVESLEGQGGRVEFHEADLGQPLPMTSSLQDVETVVQLVSDSSPGLGNRTVIPDIEANVLPQVAFLEMCVQNGVRRFVFMSSGGSVYGPGSPVPTPETCPTNPISSHGLTKLMVEKYVQMHGHVDGLEYLILRVANPFGPGQVYRKGQGLIPAMLDRWERGQPIRIFGSGEARRDYLYIDDLIDAVEAAVTLKGAPRLVLNIGSGEARSVLEVVAALEAALGVKFGIEHAGSRNTDVDSVCLDISRARETLGWVPRIAFDEGIARTIRARRGG